MAFSGSVGFWDMESQNFHGLAKLCPCAAFTNKSGTRLPGATDLFTAAPNVCGVSVRNVFLTFRILKFFEDFWKICEPLANNIS